MGPVKRQVNISGSLTLDDRCQASTLQGQEFWQIQIRKITFKRGKCTIVKCDLGFSVQCAVQNYSGNVIQRYAVIINVDLRLRGP